MNEHTSDPNIHTLDEELLIQDALADMQTLWTDTRSKSVPQVEYAYMDDENQWSVVRFQIRDNSTPTPTFRIDTPTGYYKVLASRAEVNEKHDWTNRTLPLIKGIHKYDKSIDDYPPASSGDIKELAKYLKQLDVETVKMDYEASLVHRRERKAPRIGSTLLRRFFKNY